MGRGGGRGGFDEEDAGKAGATICGIGIVLAIILLPLSLKKLTSTEMGVAYNPVARELESEVETQGLHTGSPGFWFIKFPSTFVSVRVPEDTGDEAESNQCVTKDGLLVSIQVTLQYIVDPTKVKEAIAKFKDFKGMKKVINAASVSAIHHTCGVFDVSAFQSSRAVVQAMMLTKFRAKIEASNTTEGLYAKAIDVQLRNIELPMAYSAAVSNKQTAQEDIGLAINQRTQALTSATTTLRTAQTTANKTLDSARSEANILIREAYYEGNGTVKALSTEAASLKGAKDNIGLSDAGLMSYMGIRALEKGAASSSDVLLLEPASSAWTADL